MNSIKIKICIGMILLCLIIFVTLKPDEPKQIVKLKEFKPHYLNAPKPHLHYFSTKTYLIQQSLIPILEDNANEREYKLHYYDCTQFSSNLVKKLKKQGFNAFCVAGFYEPSDYPNHTWVIVEIEGEEYPIESTRGYFIDAKDYTNYTLNRRNYCW